MAERTYTTTTHYTTTTSQREQITVAAFWFDPSYIRTLPGIIKCIQLVLDFVTFICVLAGPQPGYGGAGWGTFVTIIGFLITLTLLMLYIMHAIETLHMVPWTLVVSTIIIGIKLGETEMIYCFVWTVFYFIAACVLAVAASQYGGTGAWGVAAFFGFGAMIAYAIDCFLKFRDWRAGNPAQGMPPNI